MGIFVLVKPSIVVSVAQPLLFKAMASATEELDVAAQRRCWAADPNITVDNLVCVLEAYLREHGSKNFLHILNLINNEKITWTTRPKASLFRSKCAPSILLKVSLGPKHKMSLGCMPLSL